MLLGFVGWPLLVAPSWSWKDCAVLDLQATAAVSLLVLSAGWGWQREHALVVARAGFCSYLWPEQDYCRIYVSLAGLHSVV